VLAKNGFALALAQQVKDGLGEYDGKLFYWEFDLLVVVVNAVGAGSLLALVREHGEALVVTLKGLPKEGPKGPRITKRLKY
jgi:hypothetical protein